MTFYKTLTIGSLTLLALSMATLTQTNAAEPKLISEHNDWRSYSNTSGSAKSCFAASQPILYVPEAADPVERHGRVYFFVTRQPSKNVQNEPSLKVGFSFNENKGLTATIDGRKFTFFAKGDRAWLENAAEENTFISAMRAGSKMQLSGTSVRGTKVVYTFSLSGVTAAINQLKTSCK